MNHKPSGYSRHPKAERDPVFLRKREEYPVFNRGPRKEIRIHSSNGRMLSEDRIYLVIFWMFCNVMRLPIIRPPRQVHHQENDEGGHYSMISIANQVRSPVALPTTFNGAPDD